MVNPESERGSIPDGPILEWDHDILDLAYVYCPKCERSWWPNGVEITRNPAALVNHIVRSMRAGLLDSSEFKTLLNRDKKIADPEIP